MNTKDNQRYKDTEDTIKKSFLKLIEEGNTDNIDVSKICKVAGIHRTTFYGHYSDIYELTNDFIKDYIFEPSERFSLKKDGMYEYLAYIKENQPLFRYYYLNGIYRMEYDYMSDEMKGHLDDIFGKVGDGEKSIRGYYNEGFYRSGIEAIIKRWLYRKCSDSIDIVAKIILENCKKLEH